MLNAGSVMYLWIPDESGERILHSGKVIESDAETFVAEFEEPLAPPVGADVNAYGEVNGKFHQQGAAVTAIRRPLPNPVIAFKRVGKPVSAENRGSYRVCVATWGIYARIGPEDKCLVVDVSPEGFGVITQEPCKLGALVEVSLSYEGETITGRARCQTARLRSDGRGRYGFLSLEENRDMRKTLERITAAVQRMQLRRLARVA
jgi:hypothetical protein